MTNKMGNCEGKPNKDEEESEVSLKCVYFSISRRNLLSLSRAWRFWVSLSFKATQWDIEVICLASRRFKSQKEEKMLASLDVIVPLPSRLSRTLRIASHLHLCVCVCELSESMYLWREML